MQRLYPLLLALGLVALIGSACSAPDSSGNTTGTPQTTQSSQAADSDTGDTTPGASPPASDDEDYTLIAPIRSTTASLIDESGTVVHEWTSDTMPGTAVYLVDGGKLLRTGSLPNVDFNAGGGGGLVEMLDWDSNVLWSYEFNTDTYRSHHDVELLPSGNVLMILWELKTAQDAQAAGISTQDELWTNMIWELDPDTGEMVWEWHLWDHLTQDSDDLGRLDVNEAGVRRSPDWNHVNSVDYNSDLDQVLLSSHNQNEIWIIDHDTTTKQAAGSAGDFLWRWGNPGIYGESGESLLEVQHDAEWIEDGLTGAGNILIFNNGRSSSSIIEIDPPLNEDGSYDNPDGDQAALIDWTYGTDPSESFYSMNLSGAQRLPDGNTLIADGPGGRAFEVTAEGETVWEYDVPGQGLIFRADRYFANGPELRGQNLAP